MTSLAELHPRGWEPWTDWPLCTVHGLPNLSGRVILQDNAGICLMRTPKGDVLVHRDWLVPLRGDGVLSLAMPSSKAKPRSTKTTAFLSEYA